MSIISQFKKEKKDFPGGPVVKIPLEGAQVRSPVRKRRSHLPGVGTVVAAQRLFSCVLWASVAVVLRFSCPRACRILTPHLEIKPGSPALEGGFLTIGPRVKVIVAQLCLTLCDPMDCSPPGSSVCGILQAKILEWVAIPFSRGSS